MSTYRYTNAYPLVFSDISYGPEVIVEHTASTVELLADTPEPIDGATVVLYPGDTITVPGKLKSAWLEDLDADTAPKKAAAKATPRATRKTPEKKPAAATADDAPKSAAAADPTTPATTDKKD